MKKISSALSVLVILALCASACSSATAEGILRAEDPGAGTLIRLKADAPWKQLKRGSAVPSGADVRTTETGSATLTAGGGSFSLGPSTWVQVVSPHDLISNSGKVLAESVRDPLSISDAGQRAVIGDIGSAYRFDYGSRIAIYRGWVHPTLTGERSNLFTGQELTIGLSGQSPHMLVANPADPWDKRLLADVIEIDERLAPYRATFDVNIKGGSTLEFLRGYASAEQIAFLQPLLLGRLGGEKKFDVLVTLLISLERSRLTKEPAARAFASTQRLLDLGASFGLAAYVVGVSAKSLLQDVFVALSPHTPGAIVPTTSDTPSAGGFPNSNPTPTASAEASPTPTATDSQTQQPSPAPTASPTPTHGSPSPSPSPSPCSVVDKLTGKCTGVPV